MTTWLLGWETLLLHWLNAWVARSPGAFYAALKQSDRLPWVLAAATLAAMWFTGEEGAIPIRSRWTRLDARRHALYTMGALVGGFFLARVLQGVWVRPRPLVAVPLQAPILPSDWRAIRAAFAGQGAFPSDHAVMFFVFVTVLWRLHRPAGWLAGLVALYFSALRVGLGFHWPLDMVGGALVSVFTVQVALFADRWLAPWLNHLLLLLQRHPVLTHMIGFLVLFDLSQKFAGLFGLLTLGLGYAVGH